MRLPSLHVFGGVSRDIYVPFNAVIGIYARENGQGLFFDPSEYDNHTQSEQNALKSDNEEKTEPAKKKPSLRLLD